jgi:hypothetical protein
VLTLTPAAHPPPSIFRCTSTELPIEGYGDGYEVVTLPHKVLLRAKVRVSTLIDDISRSLNLFFTRSKCLSVSQITRGIVADEDFGAGPAINFSSFNFRYIYPHNIEETINE